MIISRIQVEEGFLDGLDLSFRKGLNVLIGPRGAGKTSIIELLRYCLGAKALTDKTAQNSREHALSILGDGRVTVTIDGNEPVIVSRTADHLTKSTDASFIPPLVLSQNEIESVGLHASGRLRLIDGIRPRIRAVSQEKKEERVLAYIRSQTEEQRSLRRELQTIRTQLRELAEQLKEADVLKKQHADALSRIQKAAKQTQRLHELHALHAALAVRAAVYKRMRADLETWQTKLQTTTSTSLNLEPWPTAAKSEDPLITARILVKGSFEALREALDKVDLAINEVGRLEHSNVEQMLACEKEGRELRRQLDTLQQGAGEIARKLAAIQERAGQQSALKDLEKAKVDRLQAIQRERKNYLDQLESIRSERYQERASIINDLNAELGPQIRITIEQAGQSSEYASAIVAALRGSGLRFNEVAPVIANEMSPREFVEAVENEDIEALANATGMGLARAARLVERVSEHGMEAILTAPIEDGVTFCLLDGNDYKTTEQLSTGQRCTVVLPLLLKQHVLSLIVDQPEDHLDNAYVVHTLVKAILQRKNDGQIIFSTHNPNIPVLGDAEMVAVLASDGVRGFVRNAGHVSDPQIVDAITSLMEGGIEAFDRRSKFYHNIDR